MIASLAQVWPTDAAKIGEASLCEGVAGFANWRRDRQRPGLPELVTPWAEEASQREPGLVSYQAVLAKTQRRNQLKLALHEYAVANPADAVVERGLDKLFSLCEDDVPRAGMTATPS